MVIARGFLVLLGLTYLAFAAWCSAQPRSTAGSVGLEFTNGSGQSEYLAVYGGLQGALGLAYLLCAWKPEYVAAGLFLGALTHGIIILYRGYALVALAGVQTITYYLAGLELGLGVVSLALWVTLPDAKAPPAP
jgi:hypothetical protein